MKRMPAVLLVVLAVGCGGEGDERGPSLSASSDSDGALTVNGKRLGSVSPRCCRVTRARGTSSRPWSGAGGSRWSTHPEVRFYQGVVRSHDTGVGSHDADSCRRLALRE